MKLFTIAFLCVLLPPFSRAQEDIGSKVESIMKKNKIDPNDPDAEEKIKAILKQVLSENPAKTDDDVIGGEQADALDESIKSELEREEGAADLADDFRQALPMVFMDLDHPDPRYALDNIGGFSSLQILYLRGSFSDAPVDLDALVGKLEGLELLREFYVVNDRGGVTEIPANIGELKHLRKLGLFGNRITELPSSIGSLALLEELYVDGNPLQSLPSSISRLKRLRVLGIAKTEISAAERARIQKLLPECKILTQ